MGSSEAPAAAVSEERPEGARLALMHTIGRVALEVIPVFHALRHLSTLGRRAEGAGEWGLRQIDRAIDEDLGFFQDWAGEPTGGHRGG